MKYLITLTILVSTVAAANPPDVRSLETRKPPLPANQTGTMKPWWTLEVVLKDGSIYKYGYSSEAACLAGILPTELKLGASDGKCTKHMPPK